MATMISSGTDVVAFLKEQHEQIKAGFSQVLAATGDNRKTGFLALRRLLAVHETAEEEIVHPAARRTLVDGELIVDARLEEEREAKQILVELEDLDVDSTAFGRRFTMLEASVLLHAQAEEQNEFMLLGQVLDREQLERMRRAVDLAERVAPTRPHPGLESATANLLVGPFVAMIDRVRDAVAGKA